MTVGDMEIILVRITSWNSKTYISCLPINTTCGVIVKAIAPRITLLLAFALLATVIAPVMAIIVEEAQDTNTGLVTWAWAYVKGTWNPNNNCYTNTWHDHASGTPGSQGYCGWWITQDINIRWYDERNLIIAAASETITYPYGGSPDADAFAII
jgi:hypothetical protein